MKKLMILILTLGIMVVVARSLLAPSASAHSVATADEALSRTERDLRTAISATAAKAQALQEHLLTDRTTGLPKDVEEFLTTTHRLEGLRDDLQADIDHLSAATNHTLAAFDHERSLIADPIARHAMAGLRTTARQQSADRLSSARQTLHSLSRVLVQGSDVLHAARCVQLAEELNTHSAVLDERIRAARDEASQYTMLTNDLLSRLTNAYTE